MDSLEDIQRHVNAEGGSMIYLVCTTNGKILTGFDNLERAETARAYWQKRIDESPLARGTRVEIRKKNDGRESVA